MVGLLTQLLVASLVLTLACSTTARISATSCLGNLQTGHQLGTSSLGLRIPA